LKIFINATGSARKDGFFTYITNLIPEINNNDRVNEYVIYSNGIIYDRLKEKGVDNLIFLNTFYNRTYIRFIWMQFILPFILFRHKIDILLSPLNTAPFILFFTSIKSYLVIHSNLPWVNQKLLPYGKVRASIIRLFKNISLYCADLIVAVSHSAKKELVLNTGINSSKIQDILLGINHDVFNKKGYKKLEIPQYKYILYIANSALHHNHINLLRAYKLFLSNNIENYKLLLIMDDVDINNTKYIKKFIVLNKLENEIKILGSINQDQLKAYYQNSTAYVFPSLSETFGFTTIEAMSCGVPVITSNCSSMPEINENAAIYFDPESPQDIAEKIDIVLENEELRTEMTKKGLELVKRYNWQHTAIKMIDLFNENSY